MREEHERKLDDLNLDLVRRIEAVCRRFEADWRAGMRPALDDYLGEVAQGARPALRAELADLERELLELEEVAATPPATIADAPTIPPSPPTIPTLGEAASSVQEDATLAPLIGTRVQPVDDISSSNTLAPHDDATIDLGPSHAGQRDETAPNRIRYFGDYEIVRELARGGMGVVFEARQVSLDRKVALKMILAGQLADDDAVRRFHIEAEAAANLDHPGIVPIYEVGQHEGQHYFSMGFVDGKSLSQRLADGPVPAREAAELIRCVAEAIEYAHQRGVIHRDLKPANILLDQAGNPRVTDFGLAKKVEGDSGLTGSGQIMGTPSYMPPEQTGGKRGQVGPAADVYALGATLYALLTGRPPFQAATAMDTVIQVVNDEPVPPRRLNASIPRDLETICLKCLQKGQSRRYASASDLAADLGRYLAGEPIAARPVTRSERAVKWARRRPAIAALLGLVSLVTVLGLGGVFWQWRAALLARHNAESQTELAESRLQDSLKAQANERDQTKLAEQRLQDSLKAQAAEKKQTELAQQRLYDVRMNLVQRYWEDNNLELFQQGLDEQLPTEQSSIDRRGFEWFYWQRMISSGHITHKGRKFLVRFVAFSPDGKRLAYAVADGTVNVWDAGTGQETLGLKGGGLGVAFSPDGKRLASAGFDQTVKVWDAATGQETLTLNGHTDAVFSVGFSPDGKRLASSGDLTVRVWIAATGRETLTLNGHTARVASVVFSPDGQWLASASEDKTLKVWDAATGQETLTLKGHNNPVLSVAFSPDGKRLASGGGEGPVKVWDASTGQETLTIGHRGPAYCVAFSPDGKRLASASYDRTVKLWDTRPLDDEPTNPGLSPR